MRFKVGDRVEITRMRDINVGSYGGPQAGQIGIISRIDMDLKGSHWFGPFEVSVSGGASYCKEEDIKHFNTPELPYDKKPYRPRDKWMKTRTWRTWAR